MTRLKLIIADRDTAYLNSLGNFLLDSYAHIFEVATFSEPEFLEQYLTEQESSGMLLISPEFVIPEGLRNGLMQVLITDKGGSCQGNDKQVFKYQRGPELVNNILQLYSEGDGSPTALTYTAKKTKVVAVYSPAGGTGKTTLAIGCSMQTAWEGKNVFYLNLENFPSTKLFFPTEAEGGLSAALFYLQEKRRNFNLKIEALKKTDPYCQIHYFVPADNGMDLWEDLGGQLTNLVQLLRNSGSYDFIFIDLSSQITSNNLAVLEASDMVLLVCTPEPICQVKIEVWLAELERWAVRHSSSILERIYPVWNKCESELPWDSCIGGKKYLAQIPKVRDLLLPQGNRFSIDLNSHFGKALYQLRGSFKA